LNRGKGGVSLCQKKKKKTNKKLQVVTGEKRGKKGGNNWERGRENTKLLFLITRGRNLTKGERYDWGKKKTYAIGRGKLGEALP